MITKFKTPGKTNVTRIATVMLFLLVGITSTFGQTSTLSDRKVWWMPIIKRHNIDLSLYNYNNSFTLTKADTAFNESWLELGKGDSFKTGNVNFKDAIFISKSNNDSIYWIIRSEIAHHDFDKREVVMEKSTSESFNLNSKVLNPITRDTIKMIRFDINTMKMTVTMGN
jgi:hypothetical protein